MRFELIILTVSLLLTSLTTAVYFVQPPLKTQVVAFYDPDHVNAYTVITLRITNPTDRNYTLVPIVDSHRWYPKTIEVPAHSTVCVNITAPDPTVAVKFKEPYTVTLYVYNTQVAVSSAYGLAPAGVIYPIINPNFKVLYNGSYGVTVYGWDIFYNGNVTVEPGEVTVHGQAVIIQRLHDFFNGSVTVLYKGQFANVSIISNEVVIEVKNATVYGVSFSSPENSTS